MIRSRRPERRALTLVEGLVAALLLVLFVVTFWSLWSSASRQSTHAQQTSALLQSAVLVQEALTRDLLRSVSLESMPESEWPLGVDRPILHLPLFERYEATAPGAIHFRVVTWRWDPDAGQLLRDGKPLVRTGLKGVSFHWSDVFPRELRVILEGDALEGRTKKHPLRFPGPPPSTALRAWRLARHHEEPIPVSP